MEDGKISDSYNCERYQIESNTVRQILRTNLFRGWIVSSVCTHTNCTLMRISVDFFQSYGLLPHYMLEGRLSPLAEIKFSTLLLRIS